MPSKQEFEQAFANLQQAEQEAALAAKETARRASEAAQTNAISRAQAALTEQENNDATIFLRLTEAGELLGLTGALMAMSERVHGGQVSSQKFIEDKFNRKRVLEFYFPFKQRQGRVWVPTEEVVVDRAFYEPGEWGAPGGTHTRWHYRHVLSPAMLLEDTFRVRLSSEYPANPATVDYLIHRHQYEKSSFFGGDQFRLLVESYYDSPKRSALPGSLNVYPERFEYKNIQEFVQDLFVSSKHIQELQQSTR